MVISNEGRKGGSVLTITYILTSIAIMAGMTYLIRVLPMAIFRKKIESPFIRSFLNYVPYSVLAAMTFPAIFSCTGSVPSAWGGCIVAILLAYWRRGLLTVAVGASAAVLIIQLIGF
ncbi:MAG TPA: AzlD domain-containing protein [Candidatus Fimimorpha faecalis]|uniref:AzlD domain-containing protein n=1 Tax=Candidatus Fimimorpha faecalis TaxID=2840824 RepID=A0A9D1EBJ9_9FIRM|nr:AzlD domain-containing protein [Candidatus Fimimorpha faecalis]